jgi:hypothetical protein
MKLRGRLIVVTGLSIVCGVLWSQCDKQAKTDTAAHAASVQDSVGKAPSALPSGSDSAAIALVPQKTCPVMGGAIDKKQFVDVNGKRIYVCCPGCIAEVKNDPAQCIEKLRAMGESVEDIPAQ